jgi:hypothetical protein
MAAAIMPSRQTAAILPFTRHRPRPEGRMYLLDLWRKQAASDEWIEAFCDLVKQWKPMGWAEEQGQIKAGVGPYLDRRQRERQAYCARRGFPDARRQGRQSAVHSRADGAGRALRSDQCALVSGAAERTAELPSGQARRPSGCAWAWSASLLDHMLAGQKPKKPEKPKNISGYRPAKAAAAGDRTLATGNHIRCTKWLTPAIQPAHRSTALAGLNRVCSIDQEARKLLDAGAVQAGLSRLHRIEVA